MRKYKVTYDETTPVGWVYEFIEADFFRVSPNGWVLFYREGIIGGAQCSTRQGTAAYQGVQHREDRGGEK